MLQGNCFLDDGTIDDKRLALYLRYETTHERAFHKCLNELLRIRAEKRKAEIGFGMWDLQNWRNGIGEGAFRCGLWGNGCSFALSKGRVGENRHAATEAVSADRVVSGEQAVYPVSFSN